MKPVQYPGANDRVQAEALPHGVDWDALRDHFASRQRRLGRDLRSTSRTLVQPPIAPRSRRSMGAALWLIAASSFASLVFAVIS